MAAATGSDIRDRIETLIPDIDFRNLQKPFFIFFGFALAFAFPLLIDGRYYLDDIGTSIDGGARWAEDGRPFAALMLRLINFQFPRFVGVDVIDLSPLPQILALAALALAAAVLMRMIYRDKQDYATMLVVFPLIGSPFYLQNLSYKYESSFMALSILLAIAASFRFKPRIANIAIGTLLIFIILGLYQAAVNVFIAVTTLIYVVKMREGESWKSVALQDNILKFVLGVLLYQLIIVPNFVTSTGYSADHSQMIHANYDGLKTIWENFQISLLMPLQLFTQTPLISLFLFLLTFIFAVQFVANQKAAATNGFMRFILIVACILIFLLCLFGLQLLLVDPVFRPRVLMGFSIFLIFMMYCSERVLDEIFKAAKFLLFIPIMFQFMLSYGYSAAAREQTLFDRHLFGTVSELLGDLGLSPNQELIIDGKQPQSPVLQISARWAIIDRLVQLNANGPSDWGYRSLEHYGLKFKMRQTSDKQEISGFCQNPPVVRKLAYQIFKTGDVFVLSFKSGVCFKP